MALTWLYILTILVALIAALSLLARRKYWVGEYGLMQETRAAIRALVTAGLLLIVASPNILELIGLPSTWETTFAAVLLIAVVYLSALSMVRDRWRKVPPSEIALWCRELGLLLEQNVPIVHALDVLARDSRSRKLYELSLALREAVRRGETISESACLPPLCGYPAELIKAGEHSGNLGTALVGLADVFERRGRLKIGEARPAKPERPEADESQVIEEMLVYLPKGLEEAEELLSTRVAGTDRPESAAENSAVVRVVNAVLAQSIRDGANHIFFKSNDGISVEYGYDEVARQAMITLPPVIRDQVARRLKLLADIPYWRRPPATGFINISYDDEPFRLVLFAELEESSEETLRLDIMPSEQSTDHE